MTRNWWIIAALALTLVPAGAAPAQEPSPFPTQFAQGGPAAGFYPAPQADGYELVVGFLSQESLSVAAKLCRAGHYEEAQYLLEKLLSLDPQNEAARNALSLIRQYSERPGYVAPTVAVAPAEAVPPGLGRATQVVTVAPEQGYAVVSAGRVFTVSQSKGYSYRAGPSTAKGYAGQGKCCCSGGCNCGADCRCASGKACNTACRCAPKAGCCCDGDCTCGPNCACCGNGACPVLRAVQAQGGVPCYAVQPDGSVLIRRQEMPSVFTRQAPGSVQIYILTSPALQQVAPAPKTVALPRPKVVREVEAVEYRTEAVPATQMRRFVYVAGEGGAVPATPIAAAKPATGMTRVIAAPAQPAGAVNPATRAVVYPVYTIAVPE